MPEEPKVANPSEAPRTGAREGGSRVYDREGNLVSVDGVPVQDQGLKKAPKGKPKE